YMYEPFWKCRSLWHTPAATVRISTSCGPGLETWTSSITSGCFTARNTAAFISSSLGRSPRGWILQRGARRVKGFEPRQAHAAEQLGGQRRARERREQDAVAVVTRREPGAGCAGHGAHQRQPVGRAGPQAGPHAQERRVAQRGHERACG